MSLLYQLLRRRKFAFWLLITSLVGISLAGTRTIDTDTRKYCPSVIPMLIGDETATVACDLRENPTGNAGDPACFYVDYSGEGTTATCGCLNFTTFGGKGVFWDCIHSKNTCPPVGTLIGTECGIHGIDFLNQTFEGSDTVAGYGCDLVDGRSCLCHHILGDNDPVSPWAWQCRFEGQDSKATGLQSTSLFLVVLLLGVYG